MPFLDRCHFWTDAIFGQMGEEIKAPKMLSSVSLMHKSVGPLVFVEQVLEQVIYMSNEK